MLDLGWSEILLLVVLVLLLFGRGKISDLMGDFGKGIKNFKKGLSDPHEEAPKRQDPPRQLNQDASMTDVTPRKDDAGKS